MSVVALLGDYSAGTTADGSEITTEFNQLINLLAGTSTTKNVVLKFSDGTTAPLQLNQTGAGALFTIQKSSVDVITVTNGGQIQTTTAAPSAAADLTRKDYVDGRKVTTVVSYFKSGALSAATNLFGQYVVPSGQTSPAVIAASFVHQTNTTVGATTINVVRRRSGANTTIGTITVPDATTVQTSVTQDFADDASTAGDIIFFDVTGVGGTPPSDTTLTMILEQKVRA